MKTFEEIQNTWQQKEHPVNLTLLKSITAQIKNLKNKNKITVFILSITVVILMAYFIWVGFYAPISFQIGLVLMIAALLTRISLELLSIKNLSQIPSYKTFKEYRSLIEEYYKSRLRLHQIITPVLLILYWIGFVLLVPTLKENLSSFWFDYVWISSIPIAIVMVLFIAFHINKERRVLQHLKQETDVY